MSANSDEQLIASYLRGDEKSLEILIGRYLKPIYNFVYQYVRSLDEAEDITQEVFVKAWRNLKKFNPKKSYFAKIGNRQEKSFKAWLFTIARNTSIDVLRKKKSIPFSEFENEEGKNVLIDKLQDPALSPDKISERLDLVRILSTVIEKLSSKYRLILSLRYNDNFTFQEIAEYLDESPNTIRSRHRRALEYLNRILSGF